ncbi:UPF0544 protein C5orf45 [Habropoda laboriosa]|uniref:UPF0544 protein C5orf45 n=1 Tax=Habropoda laboriosa TaxID=597456 RepID=A0A0L7R4E7_9HYME|nr:PREDICTED: UPF0544 protein C5orf45 [Habropoda laboriosa]KOC65699.1 UPF0544 protein C5orf45 [Habropoda laboriosa]
MSQEMNILCCSSCRTYQVHIVKKAKKWQCKICNFKQIFKQVYFKGSGKDCRLYVQKLNLTKEHKLEENASFQGSNDMSNACFNDYSEQPKLELTENKWAKYLDKPDEIKFKNCAISNSQGTSYKRSDDSLYLDNDNVSCSDNEHTNVNSDISYENDFKQDFDYDTEEEDNNVTTEGKVDNVSYNNDNSKDSDFHSKSVMETKFSKNIFDDNEDLDLTVNF